MTNRYIEVHQDPKGTGDERPTALKVVEDEQPRER
jgi:hypothetical protein